MSKDVETDDSRSPQLLLKAEDAARALAISPRTLWSLTKCGEIPCVRLMRSVRYDPQDLARFIDAQKGLAEEAQEDYR